VTSRYESVVLWLAGHDLVPNRLRPWLLARAGHRVHASVVIFPGLRTTGEGRLTVERNAFISNDCLIDCSADVTIGADVAIGARTSLLSSGHDLTDPGRRAGARTMQPIVIGDGAWLGAGSTVLPGLSVGPGVVVAAAAVVTRSCAEHGLYAGVPARRLRDLPVDPPGRPEPR
jgi:maltose O-acetyltransferase